PDCVVALIRHIDVCRRVHGDTQGEIEVGRVARSISTTALTRDACKRRYDVRRSHLSDRVIIRISNIQIRGAIHSQPEGMEEPSGTACGIGAAGLSRDACGSRHNTSWGNLADDAVVVISYIEIARAVQSDAVRMEKT